MIIINRSGDMITGAFNGEQFSVTYDEQKYNLMLSLQSRANTVETMEQLHAVVEEFKVLTQENYAESVQQPLNTLWVTSTRISIISVTMTR